MKDVMSRAYAARFLSDHGFHLQDDKDAAHAWCLERARQGVIDAQCVISTLYWSGITGNEDQQLAIEWCERAAANGSQDAQCALAGYFISGIHGRKQPERGVGLLRELVGAGHLPAMLSLGLLMMSGESDLVVRDPAGAIDLLLGPAQAGDALSRCLVGAEMTMSPDFSTRLAGVKWIELAAEGGLPMAHRYLANFYQNGDHAYPIDVEKAAMHEAIAQRLESA